VNASDSLFSKPSGTANTAIDVEAHFELALPDGTSKQIPLQKARLTIGRRAYNDLVLEHPTVSGEHAVVHLQRGEILIRDLNSRNGTLINGQPSMQHALTHGDQVEIGICKLRLYVKRRGQTIAPIISQQTGLLVPIVGDDQSEKNKVGGASPEGQSSPETIKLDRPINSVKANGYDVAIIARRRNNFFITHLEGLSYPRVNGQSIGLAAHPLEADDIVEFAGATYKFLIDGSLASC
jgi:FHA domain